jgi:hypothetical protein
VKEYQYASVKQELGGTNSVVRGSGRDRDIGPRNPTFHVAIELGCKRARAAAPIIYVLSRVQLCAIPLHGNIKIRRSPNKSVGENNQPITLRTSKSQ